MATIVTSGPDGASITVTTPKPPTLREVVASALLGHLLARYGYARTSSPGGSASIAEALGTTRQSVYQASIGRVPVGTLCEWAERVDVGLRIDSGARSCEAYDLLVGGE